MNKSYWLRYLAIGIISLFFNQVSYAHEFWIEPHDFKLQPGDTLLADTKVGQRLVGDKYPFVPRRFESFDIIQGEKKGPVVSRVGDMPPVKDKVLKSGLVTLAYASTNRSLRYYKADKFYSFLDKEGLDWVKAAHEKRGLPAEGFVEVYRRYAKSLVKAGSGEGMDSALGLPLELVMLKNPYLAPDEALHVQLLSQGEPLADTQISAFFRTTADKEAERVVFTSDAEGKIIIPRPEQAGLMLLSAVQMVEPDEKTVVETKAVWVSLWASMTFGILKD